MVLDTRLPETNGHEVPRPVRETDPNQLRMLGLICTGNSLTPFRLQELDVRLDAIG